MEGPNGPRVLLVNGSRQEIDHQTGRLNVLTFGQNEIDLADNKAQRPARGCATCRSCRCGELLDPHPPNADATCPKWIAEGHKRLATPLTALSFAFVGAAVGAHRHVPPAWQLSCGRSSPSARWWCCWRSGLTVGTLAARDNALRPVVWLHAVAPGVICGWLLLVRGPTRAAAHAPARDPVSRGRLSG